MGRMYVHFRLGELFTHTAVNYKLSIKGRKKRGFKKCVIYCHNTLQHVVSNCVILAGVSYPVAHLSLPSQIASLDPAVAAYAMHASVGRGGSCILFACGSYS